MPSETRVNPPARSSSSIDSVTLSGFASVVTSASGARPSSATITSRTCTRAGGAEQRRGAAADEDGVDRAVDVAERRQRRTSAASTSWKESRRTVAPSSDAVYVLKSQ